MAIADLPERLRGRLAARLAKNSKVDRKSGCLVWQGAAVGGYGMIRVGGRDGPMMGAHRVAWEVANGPIPANTMVRHYVCGNRRCINLHHLRLGTHQQNMDDMTDAKPGHIKLSTREVAEIFGLAMLGERTPVGIARTKREIARMYSVSLQTVNAILRAYRRKCAVDTELKKETGE